MKKEKRDSRVSHHIYAVIKQGNRKYRQRIGVLRPHADGNGFSPRLDYLPLNATEIVIRSVDDDTYLVGLRRRLGEMSV